MKNILLIFTILISFNLFACSCDCDDKSSNDNFPEVVMDDTINIEEVESDDEDDYEMLIIDMY